MTTVKSCGHRTAWANPIGYYSVVIIDNTYGAVLGGGACVVLLQLKQLLQ